MRKARLFWVILAVLVLFATAVQAVDFSSFLNQWGFVEEDEEVLEEEEEIPEPITVELGAFTVTGFEDYFSYEYGVLNIVGDEEGNQVIVQNTDQENATSDAITIEGGAIVVLNGVNISNTSRNAILVATDDDNQVILGEDSINVLSTPSGSYATVGVKSGARVTFSGLGKLIINNDGNGAGIGGNGSNVSGSITIDEGTYVINPNTGTGIGGGRYAEGGETTINGGDITVRVNPESYSAGIGGGDGATGGIITIGGGKISVTGQQFAASIGGGFQGAGGLITIMDGEIDAISTYGAAIGGGQKGAGGTINISGGTITASSDTGSCIGGGQEASGGHITISGGYLDLMMGYTTQYRGGYGSCIGDGYDNKGSQAYFTTGTSGSAVIFAAEKMGEMVDASTTESSWSCVMIAGEMPEYQGVISYTCTVYGSAKVPSGLSAPRGTLTGVTSATMPSVTTALAGGGTYTLTGDTSENVVIPAGVTAVLDLGGYTLSAASGDVITNNGTLTIQNGRVEARAKGASAVANKGTIVDVIDTHMLGNLDLSSGSTTTFTSGSVTDTQSKDSTFSVSAGATLTIHGGDFYNQYYSVVGTSRNVASGYITINGGNFTTAGYKTYAVEVTGNASLSILGGTFVATDAESFAVGATESPVVLLGGTACFDKALVLSNTTTLAYMGGYYAEYPGGGTMADANYSRVTINKPGDDVIYRYKITNET